MNFIKNTFKAHQKKAIGAIMGAALALITWLSGVDVTHLNEKITDEVHAEVVKGQMESKLGDM